MISNIILKIKGKKLTNEEIKKIIELGKDSKKINEEKEKLKNIIQEIRDKKEQKSNSDFVVSVHKEDILNLKYPDDYVNQYGRIYQIPYLDFSDPEYFDSYEELMVIRKKYPDKFRRIMLGD